MVRARSAGLLGIVLLILGGCGPPPMTRAEYARETTSIAQATYSALIERAVDGLKESADETHERMRARFGRKMKIQADRLESIIERIRKLRPPSGLAANRRNLLNFIKRTSQALRSTGEIHIRGTDREADVALLELENQMKSFDKEFWQLLKEAGVDESALKVQPIK